MKDADDLRAALKQGRGDQFEWLPKDSDTGPISETLAALANTRQGGTLLLGISPAEGDSTESVQGVEDAAAGIDRVLQAALATLPPLIIPIPKVITIDEKAVIAAQIPAGMPHVYAVGGRYLTRSGTANVSLHPYELRRLLIERGEITYETEVSFDATLDDLDPDKIRTYAARMSASDAHELLLKRGCLMRRDGQLKPTNAGLLLFGKDVGRWMRGVEITAARFPGSSMSDNFSRQDIGGTLPDQIRRAETFLRDYLRKGVKLQDTMARTELYEYPMEAARELVVNAVAHRDYSIQGDGIRLYLFKDRMEITSPGRLPGPVTVANIKDERFSRNPALVQVLADLGYIERLGYGVDRVIELMERQSLRPPEFEETAGGFRVVLHNQTLKITSRVWQRPAAPALEAVSVAEPAVVAVSESVDISVAKAEPAAIAPSAPVKNAPAPSPTEPEPPADPLEPYRDIPLNPRQETAIKYLSDPKHTRITNSELARLHPDVHAETIRRDLSDLVNKDILSKMGEKRGSYYVLKRDGEDEDEEPTQEQQRLL